MPYGAIPYGSSPYAGMSLSGSTRAAGDAAAAADTLVASVPFRVASDGAAAADFILSTASRATADTAAAADTIAALRHFLRTVGDGAAAADGLTEHTTRTAVVVLGTRTRNGTLRTAAVTGVTVNATRSRNGFLMVDTVTAAGPPDRRRWRFDDPTDRTVYIFAINPKAGGSALAKKNLTTVNTAAADGLPLIYEGDDDVMTSEFSNVVLDQAQYDAFTAWFAKRHPVLMTDDLGRRSYVVLTKLAPKRAGWRSRPFRQEYTMSYSIAKRIDA